MDKQVIYDLLRLRYINSNSRTKEILFYMLNRPRSCTEPFDKFNQVPAVSAG